MAHEELKKQYEEDCKNYEKPWKLWEFRKPFPFHSVWTSIAHEPAWIHNYEYRRKDYIEPVSFQPECFSGLNWRDAKKWLNRLVECSMDGETWVGPFTLKKIDDIKEHLYKYHCCRQAYPYIRTCPDTFKHPTVTIAGGWKLPRPEIEAPENGTEYWLWTPYEVDKFEWLEDIADYTWLKSGAVHLTEERAQAWANFWQNTIIAAIKGD